ncbi:MAG: SPOR domain-containing protein [Bacteroidia bacterium]|nr:SPOR domain-containing protein [Paludibacter sp.]NCB68103.1 SPOR domain-containing protein [Bacteroidia bacterium]
MNKTIRLFLALAVVAVASTACKSKQKVAEITGANITVGSSNGSTTTVTPAQVTEPVVSENEVTRNESFTLSEGDASAFNSKYHVVVGSFKSQTNAKGLQSTLNSEGNKALVVINEQGMYRVIIASYNEYSQAKSRIAQIQERFADAWVLVQKR